MGAKVSVLISVFNPGGFIARCIDSLFAQTMTPGDLEVIFVNDGSTDDTPALLDQLADEHEHVHAFHQRTPAGRANRATSDWMPPPATM
jgi:glycosyltransferase involved in cell wall biosynthesis